MPGKSIKITSRAGGAFDCYLSLPAADGGTPAIVLAAAVHGVDKDIRDLADEFASHGYIAAAPDLFWRTVPGPLSREDASARSRGLRRSRPARPISPTRSPKSASLRNSTAAPRSSASATAALTRSSGRSGSVTTPASPATARK